jgi:hypothetical protein
MMSESGGPPLAVWSESNLTPVSSYLLEAKDKTFVRGNKLLCPETGNVLPNTSRWLIANFRPQGCP